MLVHFRQRININVVNKVNERVVKRSQESRLEGSQESGTEAEKASEGKNRGRTYAGTLYIGCLQKANAINRSPSGYEVGQNSQSIRNSACEGTIFMGSSYKSVKDAQT
jgi:hypothetical protein